MLFLRTELRALANLFATRSGRKEFVGLAITLGCLAFGMMIVTSRLLGHEKLLQAIRDDDSGMLLRLFLGTALAVPMFVSASLIMNLGRVGLFERADARLLLASPAPRGSALWLVFWRSLIQCFLFSLPLVVVPVLHLSRSTGNGIVPALLAPAVMLLIISPVIAFVLCLHVVLMRWLASPRVKLAVQTVTGLLGVAGAALAMTGFLIDRDDALKMAERMAAGAELPLVLDAPAQWLLAGCGHMPGLPSLAMLPVFVLLPFALFTLMARFYPRAHENSIVVARPVIRTRRRAPGHGAPWPRNVAASIARRDMAEILRDPGGAFIYIFLAVYVIGATVVSFGESNSETLPAAVNQVLSMTTRWLMLSLILAMLLTPSISMGEKKQFALLASSPARRSHILMGRSVGLALIFGWVLVVQVVSALAIGYSVGVVGVATVIAISASIIALSLVFAFGTLTVSRFTDDTSSSGELVGVVLPQLLVCSAQITLFIGSFKIKKELRRYYKESGIFDGMAEQTVWWILIGGTWALALAIATIGFTIGVKNYERALRPKA